MGNDIRITVLIDNKTSRPDLKAEHGLSLWIEYREKRILFDTGQTDFLLENAEKLDIDLTLTDAIVISHGHYDHTGGLKYVLDIAAEAKIYLHPDAVGEKFSRKTSGAKSIGMSDDTKKAIQGRNITWSAAPAQLFPGITVTGRIPRITNYEDIENAFFTDMACRKADELPDDQALFIKSPLGMIIVLGCAHSGVINTIEYITKLSGENKITAVIGGMHLVSAGTDRILRTIDALKKLDSRKIAPLHCTGQNAQNKIKKSLPDRYLFCEAGTQICL
jgi:7,8-dihydropterin-6-yl-methyl-4-(beta-D-ribofuranosyl)aminobenzene 5'-phosphate synthase